MPSNFPTSLDTLSNPASGTSLNDAGSLKHSSQHTNINDIIEALQAKLGIGAGGPPASAGVLRRTATGSSGWGQVEAGDIAVGVVTQPRIWYAPLGTYGNATVGNWAVATITTPDWTGGDGLCLVFTRGYHAVAGGVIGIGYSYDAGSVTTLMAYNVPAASYQSPMSGGIPLIGLPPGSHAHNIYMLNGTAGTWETSGGYAIVIEFT